MYNVSKSNGKDFIGVDIIASFETFKEAHDYAEENICKDLFHEGSEDKVYWFSNENEDDKSYRVRIEKTK